MLILEWHGVSHRVTIGHRLPALLRAAGLIDVQVEVHARAGTPGAYHRKHLLALIGSVRDELVERGLFTESELAALTDALESGSATKSPHPSARGCGWEV